MFRNMHRRCSLRLIPSEKREAAVIDHNMAMVAFFVPLMGEIQSTQTKIFTEKIVEIWNQKVPGSKNRTLGCCKY